MRCSRLATAETGPPPALELAGQDLETTGDLGDLDLAVLGVRPAAHQLEVVDDDQPEVADPALEPAGLGPDLHHGEVRVVVDPQGRLGQPTHGPGDLRPVRLVEAAVAQLGRLHPAVGRQQALGQLEVAHLEGEEQHRRCDFMAALAAAPRANAVLPMAGRAPTRTVRVASPT